MSSVRQSVLRLVVNASQTLSVDTLVAVRDVQEVVVLVMFLQTNRQEYVKRHERPVHSEVAASNLIQRSHGGTRRRNHVVDEEEEGVLGAQLNALSDEKVELANRQVGWNQVLLLVQISNPCLRCLLDDDL